MEKRLFCACACLLLVPWLAVAEVLIAPSDIYHLPSWQVFQSNKGLDPYICEFGFRTLADHVIDPNYREFDPDKVGVGDIVYVGVWYLDWFVENAHTKISNPYILITCDVGGYLPYPHNNQTTLLFDPKVACWLAKNMLFTNHNKLFQIPMGQFMYLWVERIEVARSMLDELVAKAPHEKEFLLYLNYTERDQGRRIPVADKFWDKPYCLNRNRPCQRLSYEDYWGEVAKSKFILSPLGLEMDCTRTWESFILGSIPIVEHSYLDPLYEDLPILLIHDWDEINEDFLNEKYLEISNKLHLLEKAQMSYWAKFLHEKQQSIREGHADLAKMEAHNFSEEDLAMFKEILEKHHKLAATLIYRGNLTGLRPFQIAKNINIVPGIFLYDNWTKIGFSSMKQFATDPLMLETDKVIVCDMPTTWETPKRRGQSYFNEHSYFADLTHHRHSLFLFGYGSEIGDFCHSLEESLLYMYEELREGELLFGNMAQDSYVSEVLERLQKYLDIKIELSGNFWFCMKASKDGV